MPLACEGRRRVSKVDCVKANAAPDSILSLNRSKTAAEPAPHAVHHLVQLSTTHMGRLDKLPSVVVDKVVEIAGFNHGWRLEITCASLRTASLECAKARLGKCYRVGVAADLPTPLNIPPSASAPELTTPSWRHVAAASRQVQYLLRPYDNSTGPQSYMQFDASGSIRVTTRPQEASKFSVEPVSGAWQSCTIREVGDRGWGIYYEDVGYGRLEVISRGRQAGRLEEVGAITLCRFRQLGTVWDVKLHTRDSHLQFTHGSKNNGLSWSWARGFSGGSGFINVTRWELVPVPLALAGERFVFQKLPPGIASEAAS